MNIIEVHWNFSDNGTKEPAKSRFWNFYNFWTAWKFLMRFSLLCSGEWALSFYTRVFIYIGVFLNKTCLKTKQNIIMTPPPFIMWALFNLFESHIFFMKCHRFFMSINFVSQSLYYRSYRLFMISVTDSLWSKYNCMMIVQFESPVNNN